MLAPTRDSNNYAQQVESENVVDESFNGRLLQVFDEGTRSKIHLNGHKSSSACIHSHSGINMEIPKRLGECSHVVDCQIWRRLLRRPIGNLQTHHRLQQ